MISAWYLVCAVGLAHADCNPNTAIESQEVHFEPGAGKSCTSAFAIVERALANDPRNVGKSRVYYKILCRQ